MVQLRALAPTIVDAVKAVELGCRKIQDDPFFTCNMVNWMAADYRDCMGCLATITLMQLSNNSTTDIVKRLPGNHYFSSVSPTRRADLYGIEIDQFNIGTCDFKFFEEAIDSFRQYDLRPLLTFYGLESHQNAYTASKWLLDNDRYSLGEETTNKDLIPYADFLKNELIPKMEAWFSTPK
jgi:hypothetical protein